MVKKFSTLILSLGFLMTGFAVPVNADVQTLASDPPTIAEQSDIKQGQYSSSTVTITQAISDDNTSAGQWQVASVSSDQSFATVTSSIVDSGANAQTVITRVANYGLSEITVTVTDADGQTASDTFIFTRNYDNPNSAIIFGSLDVGNEYYETDASVDYQGFGIYTLSNRNQGGEKINWTAQWFGCDTKTEFQSTDADALNAPIGSEVADVQVELDANSCVELPDAGEFSSTQTSENSPSPKYSYEQFDESQKAFITLKLTAAYQGEVTTHAISEGFRRPVASSTTSLEVTGNSISVTNAGWVGDYRNLYETIQVCESEPGVATDYSYAEAQLALSNSNCTAVSDQSGNAPTDTEQLYESAYVAQQLQYFEKDGSGMFLTSVQQVDNTVWEISNSYQIPKSSDGSFSAPSPYQGPVITDVGADNTVSPFPTSVGNDVSVLGQNLSGVSSVLVNGIESELVSVSENSFVFTVPDGLQSGTYDLTVVSGGQNVQVQEPVVIGEGLTVEEAAAICDGQEPSVWTQRISVTQAKAYIKCGTPGVSYRVSVQQNGSGPYDTLITRTLTDIYDDRQLFNTVGRYIVRTIDLTERTRIRIYSDEEKLWQVVYNKDSFGG